MSQFRPAALLALLVAAGCYTDAPPQSTLPEPQYVSGPPGGAIDPAYGYPPYAGQPATGSIESPDPGDPGGPAVAGEPGDSDQDATDDPEAAPIEAAPIEAAPIEAAPDPSAVAIDPGAAAPSGPGAPGELPGVAAPDPAAPAAGLTDAEVGATLDGYGQWIETDDYGPVWRPDATVVGVDFTPYESGGSWVYSDAGWAFSSDYPWGWLPFHYGRWAWLHDYWGWVPGYTWGPAWVEWRHGGGVVGWRPLRPAIRDHRGDRSLHGGGTLVRDHRHAEQHDAHWRFATVSDFRRPHVRSHLYGNLAEGLRVTSRVAAPPVRARSFVRTSDLMRSRFAAGGWTGTPGSGRFSGTVPRDHRGAGPVGAYPQPRPTQAVRPPQSFQPPAQGFRAPARTYQPPAQGFRAPARTYYQPPAQGFRAPARTYYQPPARTYRPPAPSSAPARSWSPPARSSSPPPSSSSHSSASSSHAGGGSHASGGGSRRR